MMEKTYLKLRDGTLKIGAVSIPPVDRCARYRQALAEVENGEAEIVDYLLTVGIQYWYREITSLYDKAMMKLQGERSNQEVKTFTPKCEAIKEYSAGGVENLSFINRRMIERLTGSTDDTVLAEKMDKMVDKSTEYRYMLADIERLRDEHIEQLVEGKDNTSVLESLQESYSNLGD